jgi:uncharacterized membrane protein YagU involved in acid resistance
MSGSTRTDGVTPTENDAWIPGVLAGVVGGLVMGGVMLTMGATGVLGVAVPSLYTLAPPAAPGLGLVVHVSHGAVLGVVFATGLELFDVEETLQTVGAGVGYGVLTWVLLAALLMPVWLRVVGSPASPPIPNFAPPSLVWHAVYGAVLGGAFAALRDRF